MMARSGEFSFFHCIHVRTDIISITISIKPVTTKYWQAGISREVDLNEINQAGAGDAITSRPRDKLTQLYLHCHSEP